MTRYLLDTNACIEYLDRRNSGVRVHLEALSPSDVAVCSVVKAELFYGALKSTRPEQTTAQVLAFLAPFASLPFDDKAAETYGRIRADLSRKGTPIGPNDLMIASIALANDLILVTNNVGEFGRVQGLNIENWQAAS